MGAGRDPSAPNILEYGPASIEDLVGGMVIGFGLGGRDMTYGAKQAISVELDEVHHDGRHLPSSSAKQPKRREVTSPAVRAVTSLSRFYTKRSDNDNYIT